MSLLLRPGARVHFMGIGGFGMSAIAQVMLEQGYEVTGCDLQPSSLIEPLVARGVTVLTGHDPAHLEQFSVEALVISSAIPENNAEVCVARERLVPVYKRADILGQLMDDQVGVAIAGTHGKTTTSALLAYALHRCGLDPSFIVGGVLKDLGTNARAGRGAAFVIEADEYDRMYLGLRPKISVITTLELDHPDMFDSLDDVRDLFYEFADLLPSDGMLIAGYDDPETRALAHWRRAQGLGALTYGLTGGDWTAAELQLNDAGGFDFTARYGIEAKRVSLRIPGRHNVQNALSVLAVGSLLGVSTTDMAEAVSHFSGVGRRFELKGEVDGIAIIDDYAHHPTAIRATLDAARARYGKRSIWAVWQPHTYSRTKALLGEFAASLEEADHVVITDVYRSRDTQSFGVSVDDVLVRMGDHPDARHIGPLSDVVTYLAAHVRSGDVVIVMSAGDATQIGDDLLRVLRSR